MGEENEMEFSFNEFCFLGDWLYEMEEEDDADHFYMDIHYWDFVQYAQSHKQHIWKKVINKLLLSNKSKQQKVINKFNINKISKVLKQTLIDYGRNGLGNVNMEIYSNQIQEYTLHLTKLFNEYIHSQLFTEKKKEHITKKQFFEFLSYIPSL